MAEQKKSSAKAMILPPLVLAVICAVCCAFLALANMVTKDKIAAAEADAIQSSLQQLPDAGTFEEITDILPARCYFIAIPLKIKNGSGSPVRPMALVPRRAEAAGERK